MSNNTQPALLGGRPVFDPSLPMASPKLPDASALLPRFETIISSGHLTKGPELLRFEQDAANYLGVSHCIGVSSCTSGLMLALQALKRRTKPERRLIAVPSFTFLASVTAIIWAGFEPIFVEIDRSTMNICLDDLKTVLSNRDIAGVLPVHVFGNPVPTQAIESLCRDADVALLFDAAHGFGSVHRGEKVGKAGMCQVYSLTPTKLVIAGEGGLIATDDDALAEELRIAREYGNDGSYDTIFPGLNARMSELHACLAWNSLAMLEEVVAHRNRVAGLLQEEISRVPGISFQRLTEDSRSTYKDFTIQIDESEFGLDRERVAVALAAEGVPTRKYFSPPCHQHRAFSVYSDRALPVTDQVANRCLSLPLLEEETVAGIAQALEKLHHNASALGSVGVGS